MTDYNGTVYKVWVKGAEAGLWRNDDGQTLAAGFGKMSYIALINEKLTPEEQHILHMLNGPHIKTVWAMMKIKRGVG